MPCGLVTMLQQLATHINVGTEGQDRQSQDQWFTALYSTKKHNNYGKNTQSADCFIGLLTNNS